MARGRTARRAGGWDQWQEADGPRRRSPRRPAGARGWWRALGLTVASVLLWGVAHVAAGRRLAGFSLMGLLVALVAGAGTAAARLAGTSGGLTQRLMPIAVQRAWLNGIAVGLLVLALVWATVVIRSYQVVRPQGLPVAVRILSATLVATMAATVCVPLVYAANATYVLRTTLHDIFPGNDRSAPAINTVNPWQNLPRINVLLLGGDGGKDRIGIRTDSMTVASIDTTTGNTVLIGLPRALQHFQMPPRLRSRWPAGYTGDQGDQGLLNEVYLIGERHPELEPGYRVGQRGPHLLEEVIGYLLGLKIHYYALVNLAGFKEIVNAMGGVRIHVEKRLPIGGDPDRGLPPTGYLEPGWRKLNGENALWYGRSRHADDDFHRMDRQKCLMKAIVDQADPQQVLTHVQQLASAAKHTIATNIPAALLPALVELTKKAKGGADIRSLPFEPGKVAGFGVYQPNIAVMRQATARAIADSDTPELATAATGGPTARRSHATEARTSPKKTTSASASPARSDSAVSLKNVCG